jgi:hypothetical protein
MNKLIQSIWEKYKTTPLTKKVEQDILKRAESSFKKAKGQYKLSTFISWWARQRATKK